MAQWNDNNRETQSQGLGQIDIKDVNKNVDYTTIADRFWTVSQNYRSHPTGVINWFADATFPLPEIFEYSKGRTKN